MRIVAGKYRGRKLIEMHNNSIRPTPDKVRQAVFNIFQNKVIDCIFLDLFCGSGAIGFEALSRGAKEVYLVDADISVADTNSKFFKETVFYIKNDYISALQSFFAQKKKFDIIYIDPPFRSGFDIIAFDSILKYDLLNTNGCIVIESPNKIEYKEYDFYVKKYGSVYLNIFYK